MIATKSGANQWSDGQAFASAVLCLFLGVGGGYLFRTSRASARTVVISAAAPSYAAATIAGVPSSREELKGTVEHQAAVKLDQLKSDPNNVALLTEVGNIYYDGKQYPLAAQYYHRALNIQPADTSVRTDMATAYWFMRDADTAITEFNKSLNYEPDKANTLFNLGIVKWQGKHDAPGAIAAWQKLLDTNPNYGEKDKVIQLIAQAKSELTK